jgi:hypothetical protein
MLVLNRVPTFYITVYVPYVFYTVNCTVRGEKLKNFSECQIIINLSGSGSLVTGRDSAVERALAPLQQKSAPWNDLFRGNCAK